jgi:hypothetical protein
MDTTKYLYDPYNGQIVHFLCIFKNLSGSFPILRWESLKTNNFLMAHEVYIKSDDFRILQLLSCDQQDCW